VIFLLDMNLPRELGRLLQSQGHQFQHARDLGLTEAADNVILDAAKTQGQVVLTHDLDFGGLLAFSGDDQPSVVIFRCRNTLAQALFERMIRHWEELEPALGRGAIVLIEDAAVRIRRLPIGGE
jgi:predicted nuclease of predicted toxin-antitoxin system